MKLFGGNSDNPERSTHNNHEYDLSNERHQNVPQQRPQQSGQRPAQQSGQNPRPTQNSRPSQVNGNNPQHRPTQNAGGNAQRPTPHEMNNNVRRPAPQNQNSKPPKKKKSGKGWIIALVVILTLVAVAVAYWKITTRPPELAPAETENPQTDTENEKDATEAEDSDEVKIVDDGLREIGHYYTVLVVGIDQLNANTDTMMLARYDAVEHKVNLVSLPRDTLVNVADPVKKLNAVYSYANYHGEDAIDALMDAVTDISGFRPDSYVFIDTQVFADSIEALGGVYFDVPVNMNYDDVAKDGSYEFHAHFQKGPQQLNGQQTMEVFRYRKNNDGSGYMMGDIDRLKTQHDLIGAVVSQAMKLNNLPNLYDIVNIVIDGAETNMDFGNMQWYAQEFLKMKPEDISVTTLPGNYSCKIREGSYVSINVDEWVEMVNEQLNPLKDSRTLDDVSILVQNAPDTTYDPNPNNYYVTDGSDIGGGINSFHKFPQY